MKTKLEIKCTNYDFKALFKKKGYSYFENGVYNLNIIGIRAETANKVTNKYDDIIVLEFKNGHGQQRYFYNITTDPGTYYMLKPTNNKGTAILVPGQYKGVYKIDRHNNKYRALCQRLGPVKVYRDNNKDLIYDLNPETIESGYFGINIHRSKETAIIDNINNYSAGCQVFNDPQQYKNFMCLVEKAAKIWGNKFTYTLITESDLV